MPNRSRNDTGPDTMTRRHFHRPANGVLAASLAALAGLAAPAVAETPSSEWRYELTPYLWAARMNGDMKIGRLPNTSVDMKFTDVLSTLDFGFMGSFEARKGRIGLLVDGMYMRNSDSVAASLTPGGPGIRADLELRQSLLSAAFLYRIAETQASLDIIGGLRYNDIDADLKVSGSLYGQPGTVHRSGRKHWVDPYVGVRAGYPLSDEWTAVGYADFGGFHIGSDVTWQASIGLTYAFSKTGTANFGYRYLKTDYDHGGFQYDMRNDGIYGGATFRF